jgi:hypothetical protein
VIALSFTELLIQKSARIPLEIMMEHPSVTFRTDLLDCHVDICSPDFLVEFSDNFDYLVSTVLIRIRFLTL